MALESSEPAKTMTLSVCPPSFFKYPHSCLFAQFSPIPHPPLPRLTPPPSSLFLFVQTLDLPPVRAKMAEGEEAGWLPLGSLDPKSSALPTRPTGL